MEPHPAGRIDLIAEYCDRWCERCQFTGRCSLFACTAAVAMCGDARDGIQLAVGAPSAPNPPFLPRRDDDDIEVTQTPADLDAAIHEDDVVRESIERTPLMQLSMHYVDRACAWLEAHQPTLESGDSDPVLHESGQIVMRDVIFISAKLYRALDGRYRCRCGDEPDDHPVQNDWNGSAKVALLCLHRSRIAWQTLAEAWGDPEAAAIGATIRDLTSLIEQHFPDAEAFVRPGFDRLHR